MGSGSGATALVLTSLGQSVPNRHRNIEPCPTQWGCASGTTFPAAGARRKEKGLQLKLWIFQQRFRILLAVSPSLYTLLGHILVTTAEIQSAGTLVFPLLISALHCTSLLSFKPNVCVPYPWH